MTKLSVVAWALALSGLSWSLAENVNLLGKNQELTQENQQLKKQADKFNDSMLLIHAQIASFERHNVKACNLYREAVAKHVEIDDETAGQLEGVCNKLAH
jgi:hypothetical protein